MSEENDNSPSTLLQGFNKQATEIAQKATGKDKNALLKLGLKGYRTLHHYNPFVDAMSEGEAREHWAKSEFATNVLRETRNLFVKHVKSRPNCFVRYEIPDIINKIEKDEKKIYYRLFNNDVQFLGHYQKQEEVQETYFVGEGDMYHESFPAGTADLKVLHFEHGHFKEEVYSYDKAGKKYWTGILVEEKLDCDNAASETPAEVEPAVGGRRRKTRRNKRKGGRKSRKMNKKTNKRRRSKKSKTRRSRK